MSLSPVGQGAQSPEVAMPSIRMKLDNTFAAMQDDGKTSNMKVFARVRPMLQKEEDAGYRECVGVIDEQVVRAIVPNSSVKFKNISQNGQEIYEDFTYSQAFGPETGQFVFFRHTVMDIMQGFIEGQNCLLFSYGITNSGKTFTLQGTDGNPGVIPLAMRLFFTSIKHQLFDGISVKPDKYGDILMLNDKDSDGETRLKEQLIQLSEQESANKTNSSGNSMKSFPLNNWCDCFDDDFEFETETTLPPEEMMAAQSALYMKELSKQSADKQEGLCSIWISFVEIYNEYIYDLLQPTISSNRTKLMLAEDQNGDVYVKGAREICVASCDEALKLLKLGRRNLRIAATKLNYQSSRSHCIYTVKVVRMCDEENGRVNRISFCDLAGSERAAKSQTSGMHLKEAGYINSSILVLGKCLEQLRLNQSLRDKKMIPVRESKLTRLFSSHFLGKGRAVMIANASPCEYTFDETLNVLRFSALLKTVKLNDSYLSAVSSSLQNITNQWSKSRAHLSDISHNESTDMDNSLWEDIQEREEMIDKLLDLADSLRSNLETEKREKAELELKIRQEVCTENAVYSDHLLENQKRISANYIDSLKEMHQKKVSYLEGMYEKRISELLSQLQEYESGSDESSMSINKGNSTLEVEDAENSRILFASPAPGMVAESGKSPFASSFPVVKLDIGQDQCGAINSPARAFNLKSEPLHEDVQRQVEEIKSLQANLKLVTKELETTKEQLEHSSENLRAAQTEATIYKEECDSLRLQSQKDEAALAECTIEFDLFKSESLEKDIEVESLQKDKKSLEENILFLSEEISAASTKIDQLKNDETETEKYYSEEIKQLQQKIVTADEHCKDLNQKLEDCNKSLSGEVTKIAELESKCMIINSDKTKLEMEKKELEEKLCGISNQLVNGESELCQQLNKQLENINKVVQDQEAKIIRLEEGCAALKSINSELSKSLEMENEKYSVLSENNGKTDLKCQDLINQLEAVNKVINDQKTQIIQLEEDSSILKNENTELSSDYKIEKEKWAALSKEHAAASSKIEYLQEELNKEMDTSSKVIDSKLSLSIAQDKCSELLIKLEEQNSKISKLKSDCAEYQTKKDELLERIKKLEEECVMLADKHEAALKDKCSEAELHLESTLQQLEDQKSKNITLEEKFSDISSQLDKTLQEQEENALKIGNLENKNEELDTRLLNLNNVISELKLQVNTLEAECSTHQSNHVELLKDYISVEEKFGNLKEKLGTEESHLKTELEETKTQRDMYKSNYDNVCENYRTVEIAFEAATKDIASSRANSERLEQEKLAEADAHDKYIKELQEQAGIYTKEIEESNKKLNEAQMKITSYEIEQINSDTDAIKEKTSHIETENALKAELEEIWAKNENAMEKYAEKIADLEKGISEKEDKIKELTDCVQTLENEAELKNENDIESYKEEIVHLKEELEKAELVHEQYAELKENSAKNEEAMNKYVEKIAELEKSISEKEDKIKELTDCVQTLENEAEIKNENDIESYKEEIVHLKEELEKAKLLQEQYAKLEENLAKHQEAMNKYVEKIAKLEESISQREDRINVLTEDVQTLENYKTKFQNNENDIACYKEEIVHLKEQLDTSKLVKEQSDKLRDSLMKCELLASNKIKLLDSSSVKHLDEITDMRRQIKEKNTSIGELEKALFDSQKQVKEMDAKITKQVAAKRQDDARIEQIQHQKKLLEAEIYKLKKSFQAESKNEEANKKAAKKQASNKTLDVEKSTEKDEESNTSKGKKKRSFSDANKETDENLENQENSKSANKVQDKKVSKAAKVNTTENEILPKRRRVLRAQQPKVIDVSDDSFQDNDDEYDPKQKAALRKKKAASKVTEPIRPRTSRRKLQEQENMSPVKKAMQFVNSKIRSVAEAVSNMPSPRVTRGRKKLFNADATPKMAEPKWRP